MKVVVPVDMTDARLITSNIPEDDYPEYDPDATYSTGDRVIVTDPNVHNIYEVVSETSITGIDPVTDDSDPPKWLKISKTNRWRMFDQVIGTATEGEYSYSSSTYDIEPVTNGEGIAVTIRPDMFTNTLAAFNVIAQYCDVRAETLEGFIYEQRIELRGTLQQSSWYSYFYEPIEFVNQFLLNDLPIDLEKDIHVLFVETDPNSSPSVGELVTGRQQNLGKSLYGVDLGIIDFTRKERDTFGNFQIVERGFADTMEVDMSIANSDITFIKRFLTQLRAQPAIYIAGECIDATAIYGYYTDFNIVISGPDRSDASIVIESLI